MNCRDESPGLSKDLPGRTVTDVDPTVVRKVETSVVKKELCQNFLVTHYVLKRACVHKDMSSCPNAVVVSTVSIFYKSFSYGKEIQPLFTIRKWQG